MFEHLKNGGTLWRKININFQDVRLQKLDKTTRERISIIDESDSLSSDYEDSIPLKKAASKLLLKKEFLDNLFSRGHTISTI